MQPPLDIDLFPLVEVLPADLGKTPESDYPVPFRPSLLLPFLVLDVLSGSHSEVGYRRPGIEIPHLRIGPQVPDKDYLIDAGHVSLQKIRRISCHISMPCLSFQ